MSAPRPLERLEATFLTSSPDLRRCPPIAGPEIAFAGRSNAGKSSVLNRITGNKRTAKVSKTPGRTQMLNFFDISTYRPELVPGGRLIDLPGYGYAKAGKEAQAAWQKSVNEYLSFRDCLVGLVLVMDIRHPNQSYDQQLLNWTRDSGLPVCALLNKADKLGYSAQKNTRQKFIHTYKDHDTMECLTFSAMKGTGVVELIKVLTGWLANDEQPKN